MSYHIELFTSDYEIPDFTTDEKGTYLQSNRMIPVFWILLFHSKSYRYVRPVENHVPDLETKAQPFCTIHLNEGVDLFNKRKDKLFEIIPSEKKDMASEFLKYLQTRPLKFIHLSLVEWASLIGEKKFEQNFKKDLDGLVQPAMTKPSGLFSKFSKPKLSSEWKSLLHWADIKVTRIDKIENWQLAGYGLGESPWD